MVYIFGWIGMLFSALLLPVRGGGRAFTYFVLFYCLFIAFFRSYSGTDTANYISILDSMLEGKGVAFGEPAFKLLSFFLIYLFNDAELAVRSISLVFFTLLALYFYRSNKNEAYLFVAYIMPTFAYSYSMNGLRIGVAAAFFLLAIKAINKKGINTYSVGCLFLSFLFHFSAIILPIIYFMYKVKWLKISFLIQLTLLFIILLIVFVVNIDYISGKILLYSGYNAPSIYSGARVIIPLLLIIMVLPFGRLPNEEKQKIIFFSIILLLISIVLTQFSYAGLRALDLLSLVIPVVILMAYNERRLEFDLYIKIAFLVSAALAAAATYMGFINEYGTGGSPFLPYTFSII